MIRFSRHRTLSWEVLTATHRNKCKWVSSPKHASSSHSLATQQEENHTVQPISELHREGHELNPFAFTAILKLLVGVEWGELSWNIHAPICKLGHDSNAFVGTALVDAYSVCGFVDMARKVFDGITDKDMVSWSGMVACYAENVCFEEAIESFSEMRVIGFMQNQFTLASVLKACLGLQAIEVGKGVHGFLTVYWMGDIIPLTYMGCAPAFHFIGSGGLFRVLNATNNLRIRVNPVNSDVSLYFLPAYAIKLDI
ncbi:hypothetical protein RJ639_003830 [Escallonia herrerae]|uniref:Pentatricopeptide repeat-containing protein n=1 Tax=Escallonia herrerae TaxID=1293975 RepID=A0AA88W190_9ASTE|nr:hypothetical protein RJ639_003830 [Escallonia herrerae]